MNHKEHKSRILSNDKLCDMMVRCSRLGQVKLVNHLIKLGCSAKCRHNAPLREALFYHQIEVCDVLIHNGALLSSIEMDTALCWAVCDNDKAFLDWLLKHGASLTVALGVALNDRNAPMIKFLLRQGARVDNLVPVVEKWLRSRCKQDHELHDLVVSALIVHEMDLTKDEKFSE